MRRAFTLMEVLLAVALVLLLSGAVYGFLWNLLSDRDRLGDAAAEGVAANALIERLEADLLGSLAGVAGRPGIRGTTSSIAILSRRVSFAGGSADGASGDLHGAEIVFDAGAGVVRARAWAGLEPGGTLEDVALGVQRLRFRYFDGRDWKAEFDSAEAGELPAAVEVAIWFGEPTPPDGAAAAELAGMDTPDGNGRGNGRGSGDGEAAAGESTGDVVTPARQPDRVRVIVVPDAPAAAWKEGA